MSTNKTIAKMLRTAQKDMSPCGQPSAEHEMSVADAYAIQGINIEKRLEQGLFGAPTRVVGRKIGLTSKAIQDWLKVSEPDFGTLLSDMVVADDGEADTSVLLQPRAEAEVAFVMNRDLKGPGITATDVMRATEFVVPAIEIIDSRIADWKITYEDTVADNASSGLFVVGSTPMPLDGLDLRLCGMALRKNGKVVSTGAGAACLGHPVNAVVWLANKLGELGSEIREGDVVLSGALGPVTPVQQGDFLEAVVDGLGKVRVKFA